VKSSPHRYKRIVASLRGGLALLAVAAFAAHAEGTRLVNEISGKERRLPVKECGGVICVSLSDLCEGTGFVWKWDLCAEKLTCSRKGLRLTFVRGMPFCLVNDTLRQMPTGPVRDGGLLYAPVVMAAEVFSRVTGESVSWRETDSTMVVTARLPAVPEGKTSAVGADVAKENDTALPGQRDAVPRVKQPQRDMVQTIVIDPGHGGMDPGAIGQNGLEEKKVVLDIALALRDLFKKKTKFTVLLTRDSDKFIPLVERTRFANEKKADIFVSIHANSIEGNKRKKDGTRGYKVYFLSEAKNEEDKLAAMRENAVIELEDKSHKYDNLQNILIDMAGNEYLRESQDFSIMVTETFSSSLKDIPRLHLGVGQANFWVLNGTYMPSVLIEVGFISNPQEEKDLNEPSVQKSIASGIFEAVMNFKKKYEEGQ
jgi:N-acetylmuramoyl-L-alanine amidase